MFLLGAAVLGMKFALTTLVSTFYYPVILGVLEQIPALQNVTDDKMLSTICGGLMIGMGIGIVIRCGASTGEWIFRRWFSTKSSDFRYL